MSVTISIFKPFFFFMYGHGPEVGVKSERGVSEAMTSIPADGQDPKILSHRIAPSWSRNDTGSQVGIGQGRGQGQELGKLSNNLPIRAYD